MKISPVSTSDNAIIPIFFTLFLMLFSLHTFAQESGNPKEDIRLWHRNFDSQASYQLLKLALEKTQDVYGAANIIRSEEMTQGRAELLLSQTENDHIDVISMVPDTKRITNLRPIYIAVEEGLVGYRICVIKRENENLFNRLRNLRDVQGQNIVFGQGAHWPDTTILRENGLTVETSVSYKDLFSMLEKGRFHCYLRGANEALSDLKRMGNENLILEPNLLFLYPSASLFFVRKDNVALAYRIELGLRRAILDESYKKLFNDLYAEDIETLGLNKRRLIRLDNPLLSEEILSKSTKRVIFVDGKIDY